MRTLYQVSNAKDSGEWTTPHKSRKVGNSLSQTKSANNEYNRLLKFTIVLVTVTDQW